MAVSNYTQSDSKLCTKCGVIKKFSDFSKSKSRKDGLNGHCRECIKQWRLNNLGYTRQRAREYREKHKEKVNLRAAEWRKNNQDRARKNVSDWISLNKDRKRAADRAWRIANKDINREKQRAARVENARRREFRKRQAVPLWANLRSIKDIYILAESMRKQGRPAEVDHIVPLRSDLVCGLHCEANLKIVSGFENRAKGNRWWPDMP